MGSWGMEEEKSLARAIFRNRQVVRVRRGHVKLGLFLMEVWISPDLPGEARRGESN